MGILASEAASHLQGTPSCSHKKQEDSAIPDTACLLRPTLPSSHVCFGSSRAHRRRNGPKGSVPAFTENIVSCTAKNIAPEAWNADVIMAGVVISASYGCLAVRHPRSIRHCNTGANQDSLQKESLGASPRQVVSQSTCSIPPCHVLYQGWPVIDRSAYVMCRNPGGSTDTFHEVTDAYEVVSAIPKGSRSMTKLHMDMLNKLLLVRVLPQFCQACVIVNRMQAFACQCLKQCLTQACCMCSAHETHAGPARCG